MSSFVQAPPPPVIYGPSLASKYPPPTAANCYYPAGCHGGGRSVVGDSFYGASPTAVDSPGCYTAGDDYDAGGYGQQVPGFGGRYGQLPQQQQQQPQHQMYVSEYRPHDVYRSYCDQPPPAPGPGPAVYGGEARDCSSAGLVPASSPAASTGLCSGYSPPSAPPQRAGSAPQPPVIYPWMKMVHSVSGKLFQYHAVTPNFYSIRSIFLLNFAVTAVSPNCPKSSESVSLLVK